MRKTLFISHANPEDNEFTIWLASRLQLLGYKVWCDLEGLIGGEKFWSEIDNEIRNNTIKFLLVLSNSICNEPGVLKDGIDKEISLAESIAKKLGLKDLIIPLNIDEDAPFNSFIGLNRYKHITFHSNWAVGLKQLIKKLEKDKVPKDTVGDNRSVISWYENEFTTKFGLYKKKEKYYSNWWPIEELPENLYLYQYENEKQAKTIYAEYFEYPIIRHGNILVTFTDEIKTINKQNDDLEILPIKKYQIGSSSILNGFDRDTFPTLLNAKNLLNWLLNRTFHLLMKRRGLYWYEMANKSNAYFFPKLKLEKNRVKFSYPNREKTKNLVGRYKINDNKVGNWHFAVSSKTLLYPTVCFSLKSHILFSDNGYHIWKDSKRLHSARRNKGKKWFNEEWRDQLIAFINAIKDENGKTEIPLNKDFTLKMPLLTLSFYSNIGYNQPEARERQNLISISKNVDEYYQDVET